MAVANIIARGIGFSPGSVKFIVTHGFSIGDVVFLFAPNLGRTVLVARSDRTAEVFSEKRTAKVARDPDDAIILEQ